MSSENNNSMLILLYKKSISNYETYRKNPCYLYLEDINISIVKLIIINNEIICNG